MLWSIALPGFGQYLNNQYIKGTVLLLLEFVINVKSHLNLIIISSFTGRIDTAIAQTDYEWLMFYPCLYMYAIWDAYHHAVKSPLATAVPFALAAYLATVGIIFSSSLRIGGVLLGPVWLPMLCCFLGLGVGYAGIGRFNRARQTGD
ncbi:hypothetical protein [Paenibacillus flagellatus]|uniref:hypothetical protein n=1 Tax=Paenibacillus flagellatus TaxID=2211139 RepID=UPI001FE949AD|nr:hypothetical protein [Paenibacillus flagellatus]